MSTDEIEALKLRVHELEKELKDRRKDSNDINQTDQRATFLNNGYTISNGYSIERATHNLLLLSDSALPLGSFAYSSGLESFIAHNKPLKNGTTLIANFHKFLELSLSSIAGTNVPYLLAAHRNPADLFQLDNDFDASTPCTVARRASVAQGRALIGIWERAFLAGSDILPNDAVVAATQVMKDFSRELKVAALSSDPYACSGHFAPLWGVVTRALSIEMEQAAYIFLLNHAKAVLSAAVRAAVMGPYQAQAVLASKELPENIHRNLQVVWDLAPEDAAQVVPPMDLWVGRHELLYSRIFNS